ncbi:ATP-binding protein [Thioalkalivibrio sp. ALMg11]|uniref:AAA family ATPase n=1 Tax=Thioalkalivibrio sp. ALMg11 TaxID=1158165 RepID=UPI000381688E|nr:ATP-binding protein [Thioalkalivibrio sp. ALMg11]
MLWSLRVLAAALPQDASGKLDRMLDQDSLEGLGILLDDEEREHDELALERAVQERLQAFESDAPRLRDHPIAQNVRILGEPLGLNGTESEILEILTLMTSNNALSELLSDVREACDVSPEGILAIALNRTEREIRKALAPRETLVRSGLVEGQTLATMVSNELGFNLLRGLASELSGTMDSPDRIFTGFFRDMPAPEEDQLPLPHLESDIERLKALLLQAIADGVQGVNILLYGPPGTGKTQIARRIAQETELRAREVNHEDAEGVPMEPHHRQRAYQLCQYLLRRADDALIVFDEIEDVFGRDPFAALFGGSRRPKSGGKAWTNQMLEENAVPAIWITNHPDQLDPAYLRRFDYALEVGHPPRSVRRALLTRACEGLDVTEAWLDHTAGTDALTPAEIRRAARVARLLRNGRDAPESIMADHLNQQAELQGRPPLTTPRGLDALDYGLEYLNTDTPVEAVIEDLIAGGQGTLLAYGPPGTGKTALAHHLAEQADRPLRKRTASELISPYVGMTEKNLARAFREARKEGAVLLLDEADSFLTDRSQARQSWETTRTNELLVQIEAFDGILVCATNFLEALDPAALRRFDHKLELRPLDHQQRAQLFEQLVSRLQPSDADDRAALDTAHAVVRRLDGLTPGDFATVVRGHSRRGTPRAGLTLQALANALVGEHRIKPGTGTRRAGFA